MKVGVVLSLVAACGRVGFEPGSTGDGRTGDGSSVLDALPIESDPALIARWTFDEPAGATSFADATGHGNTGTCTSCPTSGAPGKRGHAVAFGQSNAGIHIGAQPTLASLTGPFTLAAWVQVGPPTGPSTYGVILSNDRDCCGTFNGFSLWATFYDHGPALLTWSSSLTSTFGGPLPAATWKYVVGTYDGTMARVYVDGIEVASDPTSVGSPFSFDLWIGCLGYMAPNYHAADTSIDELIILGRALAPTEISALFASY